jgi:hypothetical protein
MTEKTIVALCEPSKTEKALLAQLAKARKERGRQVVVRLKKLYPEPRRFADMTYDEPANGQYCVGGALTNALGISGRFPDSDDLVSAIIQIRYGKSLHDYDLSEEWERLELAADIVANLNDKGKFHDAWKRLETAIVTGA